MVTVPAIEMTTMKRGLDVNAYMEEFGQINVTTVLEKPAKRVNVHGAWITVVIEQNVMKIVSFFSLN